MNAQIFVEDWDPSYDSPYQVEEDEIYPTEDARIVEDGGHMEFHPGVSANLKLVFVDGIRRIEGGVYHSDENGETASGLAGVYAVGSVVSEAGEATFGPNIVKRVLIWPDGISASLGEVGMWRWEMLSTTEPGRNGLSEALQDAMRGEEATLAKKMIASGGGVILDGPLTNVKGMKWGSVGYIKTHHQRPVSLPDWQVVARLPTGNRTSLFAPKSDIYSCYIRLATPGPISGPYSGIARLEIPAEHGLDGAQELATLMAGTLPRLAGRAIKDPRAPQNLEPIGALEQKLRHDLGDIGLANRALRQAAANLRIEKESSWIVQ